MPKSTADLGEGHAVLAVGYSDQTRLIKFVNCWGGDWGDNGVGYIPYQYFSNYMDEAWFRDNYNTREWIPHDSNHQFTVETRGFVNELGYASSVTNLWHSATRQRAGWCFATARSGHIDIEDLFLRKDFQSGENLSQLFLGFLRVPRDEALPIRFLVPHADIASCSENFWTWNYLLRGTPSLVTSARADRWCARIMTIPVSQHKENSSV